MFGRLLISLCLLFLASLAQAAPFCGEVFLEAEVVSSFFELPDSTADAFRREMDEFVTELENHRSIMDLANQIEAKKQVTGNNKRSTRSQRDIKIRQWRFFLRTGDLFEIVESMRNYFDNAKSSAVIFAKSQAYLLSLETGTVRQQLGDVEWNHHRQVLSDIALEYGEILARTYADYSAAEMVLRELKQHKKKISDENLDVAKVEEKLQQDSPAQLKGAELVAQRSIQETVDFFNTIQNYLPIGGTMKTLYPKLFGEELVIDRTFVKRVFRGDVDLYGGQRPAFQELPLRLTLQRDLAREKRRASLTAFMRSFGHITRFVVSKAQIIPGKGYSLEQIASKDGILSKTAMTFNSLGHMTRSFIYLFFRTVENIRAAEDYAPNFYRLENIRDNRGDDAFFNSVIKLGRGDRDFYMNYSRLADVEVHKDYLKFKGMLKERIEQSEKAEVTSPLYKEIWSIMETAETRGQQLGPLSAIPKSKIDRFYDGALVVGGVSYVGFKAYQEARPFLDSLDPSALPLLGPFFGQ